MPQLKDKAKVLISNRKMSLLTSLAVFTCGKGAGENAHYWWVPVFTLDVLL